MISNTLHKPSTWGSLLRFEWVKLIKRRITWVPFIVITLVVALIVIAFHKGKFTHQREIFKAMSFVFNSKGEFVNGYFMASYTMSAVFTLLMPIFITVASGLMVAGEYEQGTLRASLIRPISRTRLILAKFMVLTIYSQVLVLFAVGLLTAAGIANFGTGTLYAANEAFNNGHGMSVIPENEVPMRLVCSWLLGALGMMVLAAVSLLVSSLVESAAMAYVVSLSIYFAFMVLRAFNFLDWLHPYLFVTHMMRWQQCFFSYIKTGDIFVSLVHEAGYLGGLLTATALLFSERDIKN